ncbi:cholecystokinin receptor [Esox lucius]|uniref:Gastrin/cholecystokinin type B receptor n=1 Tax=Esox lucius TaxID=8010 RepID=A0AAY5KKE0_ESOLU|nr:cholecystokinin receptor [Esox lucius]
MDLQTLNETSTLLECVGPQGVEPNGTGNASLEFRNITTCGNASMVKPQRVKEKEVDSLRILLYSVIFLLSVFGNLLIIVVLTVNKRMRTVTNSFLLSLAVSDLMMAIFCMPFTLIPNLMEDFIFGAAMCKILSYLMGVSVSISTFSLVAIAIERYSAICNPLKSRAWQTRSHAYRVIAATWLLSFMIMSPYPVFTHLVHIPLKDNTTIARKCRHIWPQREVEQTWNLMLLLTLFVVPGVVMMVAYGLISRELYRGMQFELGQKTTSPGLKSSLTTTVSCGSDDGDGCYVQVSKRPHSMEMSTLTSSAASVSKVERARSNTSEAKLLAKKRVIRMLVVIVVLFFLCWLPLYFANTWKAFHTASAYRALSGAPISFIHLLSYTSACVNPLIYCFMNTRFRKALLATFACCHPPCRHRRRGLRDGEEDAMTTGASMSKFSYTTVSSMATC